MKQFFITAVFLLTFGLISVNAQDLIILKNGNVIEAKVTEISAVEIRYLRSNHLDGPVIVILKADVLSIRYENGTVEVIEDTPISSAPVKPLEEKIETVTVIPPQEKIPIVTSVTVTPANAVVARGRTQRFTAIVEDDQPVRPQIQETVQTPQPKEIPARPQLGQATVLQQILNSLPAIPNRKPNIKIYFRRRYLDCEF